MVATYTKFSVLRQGRLTVVFGGFWPPQSTATSALGKFMTKHTMYATAHGNVPSNTSRYASTDIGLLHMVGLDLNKIDDAQLAWLEADLQAVNKNRERTPWIMVMSHFPIYHSVRAAQGRLSGISISHRKSILYGAFHFVWGFCMGAQTA